MESDSFIRQHTVSLAQEGTKNFSTKSRRHTRKILYYDVWNQDMHTYRLYKLPKNCIQSKVNQQVKVFHY